MSNKLVIKSLESLAKENSLVLWDTSAISCPIFKSNFLKQIKCHKEKEREHADFREKNNIFIHNVGEYIKSRNFFTTNFVLEEIGAGGHYGYKQMIKREGCCRNRELLRLRRAIKEERHEKGKVINAFTDNNKIILLDDEKRRVYFTASKKYQNFKTKYELSDTDFDFLITGLSLAATSRPVIFLSNDLKIYHARNEIVEDMNLNRNDARFFIRDRIFEFREI